MRQGQRIFNAGYAAQIEPLMYAGAAAGCLGVSDQNGQFDDEFALLIRVACSQSNPPPAAAVAVADHTACNKQIHQLNCELDMSQKQLDAAVKNCQASPAATAS